MIYYADEPFPNGMVEEISEFLRTDDEPRGEDIYNKVFETGLFFPLQRKRELVAMMQMAKRHQVSYGGVLAKPIIMEIGADKGGSVYHWCKCLSPQLMIVNEIRGTPYSEVMANHFKDIRFHWLPFASENCYDSIHHDLVHTGQLIDILFIDGGKHRIFDDYQLYRPLMRAGGVVFIHDIKDKVVRDQFLRIIDDLPDSAIDLIVDTTEAYELGPTDRCAHDAWLRHWKGRSCGVGVVRT